MWTFKMPVVIRFGSGAAAQAANLGALQRRRIMVVTDPCLLTVPAVAGLIAQFPGAGLFQDVEPNPTVENVDALAARLRANASQALLAIGGGSVMDCAKAAAVLASTTEPTIRAFHATGRILPTTHLDVVAVPTTAGTGSEVTPFAVLDDKQRGVKAPIASDALYPSVAIVDPILTESMPRSVTAATGMDALAHAMEGYWSINHQPICDVFAIEAARLIFANLEWVCRDPRHAEGRSNMAYAALLAGMAFQLPKNAMVHACSFPLSQRCHLAHGAACALTLGFALRLNAPAMGGRMEHFAEACGFRGIEDMTARIRELKRIGGLPVTLAEAGIGADQTEALVTECSHPLLKNNPVEVTPAILRRMFLELAEGDA